MKFKYKTKITLTSLFINLVVLTGFFYLMINVSTFGELNLVKVQAYHSNLSLLKEEISDDSTIDVNEIYLDDNLPGVVYYIVQKGDTISKIALNFGVTVNHIKKVNHLSSDIIKVGQKLTITDQEGFVYVSKGESLEQLAQKFDVSVNDIVEANGLVTASYKFSKGDEVFIPMTEEQYKSWLKRHLKSNVKPDFSRVVRQLSIGTSRNRNIVAKYWYKPNVSNGFYRGQCTRFVAIKKFPYITKTKQKKLWNGNARYWYQNAKAAGYPVGHTPKVGSIVVFRYGGRRYYYAGHVAIVKKIDWKNKKLLIEEMNAIGKYIVTLRWVLMNNDIIGYIYL